MTKGIKWRNIFITYLSKDLLKKVAIWEINCCCFPSYSSKKIMITITLPVIKLFDEKKSSKKSIIIGSSIISMVAGLPSMRRGSGRRRRIRGGGSGRMLGLGGACRWNTTTAIAADGCCRLLRGATVPAANAQTLDDRTHFLQNNKLFCKHYNEESTLKKPTFPGGGSSQCWNGWMSERTANLYA